MALVHFNGSANGGLITIRFQGFNLEQKLINGKQFEVPTLEGAFPMLREGCPDVPKISTSLQLPSSGSYSIQIISSKYEEFNDIEIAPSAGNILHVPGTDQVVFNECYMQDAFYPGNFTETDQPYISREKRCQSLQFFPFQYNPVTKVLRVFYEIDARISIDGNLNDNPLSIDDQNIKSIPGFHSSLLNSYSYPSVKSGLQTSESGRMLVICPAEFSQAMEPFIDWKLKCGIRVELVDASLFTDATQLSDFIKNYYYEKGDLVYLLLVGDADKVPTIMLPYGASDNSFAYIAGNDRYPDILVGRFSASSSDEVESMVKKTIQYESDPEIGNDWISRVTGIASTLSPGDDGEADYQHIRNLMKDLTSFTYTRTDEFFDGSQGGTDKEEDPETSEVLKAFNEGTGCIIYAGHGSTTTWATAKITRSVISMIDNPGMYPFIISAACETGNFAGASCLAETWMRASKDNGEPLGAVACLMASGSQTTYPPMEGQDEMIRQITQIGSNTGGRTFGGIAIAGMNRMNNIYGDAGKAITDTWILFGDPSLQIRTATPTQLSVSHDAFIGYGRSSFSLKTPEKNGIASLTAHGTLIGNAILSEGSTVIQFFQPIADDSVLLTVTAFNQMPYSCMIPVIKLPTSISNAYPVNHSERNPISATIKWDSGSGGIPDHYVLYLGTDNPPTNLLNGVVLTDNSYQLPSHLNYETTYYWRVDAVNDFGTAPGEILEFTTIYGPDEDFENWSGSDIKWEAAGSAGWLIDTETVFNGLQSARSGFISDGDSSFLIYPCIVEYCDFVGFWSKLNTAGGYGRLFFRIDGQNKMEIRGNSEWEYSTFDIEPGHHLLEWIFVSSDNNTSQAYGAWLDDISLPIHSPTQSYAGEGQVVCAGQEFQPEAWALNYNSIQWETDGDGQFNDPSLVSPSYVPGPMDIEQGETRLRMRISGFDHCQVQTHEVLIFPVPLPGIQLPSDTVVMQGNSMVLDATSSDAYEYLWLPGNIATPSIQVDSAGAERGTKTLTLRVTNMQGCSVEKTLRIYFPEENSGPVFNVFPNPCKGKFSLESENGATRLSSIYLVNLAGKKIWEQQEDQEIINRKEFVLPELPSSVYYLITENESGRFVVPLSIQK
ncbi:MAG: hypothetical protein IPH84_11900 [Bacteroidales bacterium]|nr:hypothetical protein [Bacteroidales bacterium]